MPLLFERLIKVNKLCSQTVDLFPFNWSLWKFLFAYLHAGNPVQTFSLLDVHALCYYNDYMWVRHVFQIQIIGPISRLCVNKNMKCNKRNKQKGKNKLKKKKLKIHILMAVINRNHVIFYILKIIWRDLKRNWWECRSNVFYFHS